MLTRCFVAIAWVLFTVQSAHAAPVETLAELLIDPADEDHLVARYRDSGGGLFFSHDGGQTWAMSCNAAFQLFSEAESLAVVDGGLYMGMFAGLLGGPDPCSLAEVPALDGKWVSDITTDPMDNGLVYAISSNGAEAENGIYQKASGGEWAALGTTVPTLIARLRVAELPAAGRRFYMSIVAEVIERTVDGLPSFTNRYALRHSDDQGQTWTENSIGESDGEVRLLGVDPSDPDTVLVADAVRVIGDTGERVDTTVLVSQDRGENWRTLHTQGELGGFAMAPDGRLWIGDAAGGGLFTGRPGDTELSTLEADREVRCLAYSPTKDLLYVCDRFVLGSMDPSGGPLEELFDVIEGRATLLSCDDLDVVEACLPEFEMNYCNTGHFPCAEVCKESFPELEHVAQCFGTDGGVVDMPGSDAAVMPDATDAGGSGTDTTPDASCSCRVPGAAPVDAPPGLLGLALLAGLRWRSRRRR